MKGFKIFNVIITTICAAHFVFRFFFLMSNGNHMPVAYAFGMLVADSIPPGILWIIYAIVKKAKS